jgi:hypothetical protein
MKKTQFFTGLIILTMISASCGRSLLNREKDSDLFINQELIENTIDELKELHDESEYNRIVRGVTQIADLWTNEDGNPEEFKQYCIDNFVAGEEELYKAFHKLERNFEILFGSFNYISVRLMKPLHLTEFGEIHPIDHMFGAYSASSHLIDDLYNNKIAFYTALNFPAYSLQEKSEFAAEWTRKDWAYARMGDIFTSRIPPELLQNAAAAGAQASSYIDNYNIYMGKLITDDKNTLFPEDMVLISHWGLRDELKSNYNQGDQGLQKQLMIYQVMQRIIRQEIPIEVINSGDYYWNPYQNKIFENEIEKDFTPEESQRFSMMLEQFNAEYAMDKYNSIYPTYIERAFDQGMELTQPEVEELFVNFITAPEIAEVGKLIKERLGRDLQPFDIWYDGFKARTDINEEKLNEITKAKYPTAKAYDDDIARMLIHLGWEKDKAEFLASKIVVEGSRGAGHAWGAAMKDDVAHLRTRVGENGMDYKGYNIAMHELGHNVEQVITLHDVDYYMMNGVPNTAFTEAIAFMFQHKDLEILGYNTGQNNQETEALAALDNCWSSYEIMGVSLVDMYIWQWLYENPDATPEQLRDQLEIIAIDVWNEYYYPVFGVKDSPILGIYSHMITSPLYLSNYPVGKLIEFQVGEYVKDKAFAEEVTRMLVQGTLIPQEWMRGAVGREISGEPTLNAVKKALKIIN